MKYPVLILLLALCFCRCRSNHDSIHKISGEAQGTTYQISFSSDDDAHYGTAIDSILKKIDSSLSAYLPASIISRINSNDENVVVDDHFIRVFKKATEVSERTGGAFDVTVAPVINAWGFGTSKKVKADRAFIDSLLPLVGYKKVKIVGNTLVKDNPGIMLDFNAHAQGYTVDVIAAFLEGKGIRNYFVELGGEVLAKGKKYKKDYWKIGIDKPVETIQEERALQAVVKLYNRALATSGNYRKFFEENGQKFSHIIDPVTGYPAKNNLLSSSVFADDCMTADAYATAFMVMGLEKSIQFISENKELNLEVFFIYDEQGEWKIYTSDTLKKWIEATP